MAVFEHVDFDDHEQVVFVHDAASGLRGIIAIHDTSRGRSLGGCRIRIYAAEEEALADALRLSRGMTYKSALAGLPLGGGKAVLIGDPETVKTPAFLKAYATAIDRLGGRYITAEDMGTTPADMAEIGRHTRWVAGIEGDGGSGDPSPFTACGVAAGIAAAVDHAFGGHRLEGKKIAIQGLGAVGRGLAGRLAKAGAELVVADIDDERVTEAMGALGAKPESVDAIHAADVDVFAPCAMGGIINDRTIPSLKARIVAGAANNQLEAARHGPALHARGICYVPDYAINAGGIINIAHEPLGESNRAYDREKAMMAVLRIGDTVSRILIRSGAEGLPTSIVADTMAAEAAGRA